MKYVLIAAVVSIMFGSLLVLFFAMEQQRLIGEILAGGSTSSTEKKDQPLITANVSTRPLLVTLKNDLSNAKYVGHTADGRQFFLTTPFIPETNSTQGEEFLALYIFDNTGKLVDSKIEQLGRRATVDKKFEVKMREEWIRSLGQIGFGTIQVQPFSVKKFDTTFGFIEKQYSGRWFVEVQPGNYMSFHEPWTSGEYDT